MSNGKPRVVITGIGTVNPIANDAEAFYDALIEGKSGIATLQGYPTDNITSKIAGQIKNLDIAEHISAKDMRRTARFSQIAIIAARRRSSSPRCCPTWQAPRWRWSSASGATTTPR